VRLIEYVKIKHEVLERGYLKEIVHYIELKPCTSPDIFASEAIWVILCSGMKEQIARKIEQRVWEAINNGGRIELVFGHEGKAKAISYIFNNRFRLFNSFLTSPNQLDFLESLPWIGPRTKYHLAKNLGMDACKPDRHLVRIAGRYGMTPVELCEKLARESRDKVAVVDAVLWRAANLGMV